jgi:hypothetical protein
LFKGDADGDALAQILMRAATRAGAPASTLRYAERVAASSPLRDTPEYNWLVGAARFQENDFAGAESLFIKVWDSKASDHRHKQFAANGLVGVYARLNRPVDQLWAAFQSALLNSKLNMSTPSFLQTIRTASSTTIHSGAAFKTGRSRSNPTNGTPMALPSRPGLSRQESMSAEEANRFKQLERDVRDQQEEYWRAYLILNNIVERVGHTALGRKSAREAIVCLRKIAVHRFGRVQEIREADTRLSNWFQKDK